MTKNVVSVVRYAKTSRSVQEAVTSCGGLDGLPANAKVFIKPNIVFWTRFCEFPKWGVITTSRVVEDTVIMLKEHGVRSITIGEGMVAGGNDGDTAAHAYDTLGYTALGRRYGVKVINVMERPFLKVDLGEGIKLRYNRDMLESDFLVDLPVLKTHSQTVVSLGIKNLKGLIDIASRKKCHCADPQKNLHFHISRLSRPLPPSLTLIDGIYSLEKGPGYDGKMHRTNLLIASADMLSADLIGARILGYDPSDVPHLTYAAQAAGRPLDCSDIEVRGERVSAVASRHSHHFDYISDQSGEMPAALHRDGVEGLYYRKFDDTMCTYCSFLNGIILAAIRRAWQGEPWEKIEVLTGKAMEPSEGMASTVLIGRCMVKKNRDHPLIRKMYAAGGCPPDPKEVITALNAAGIAVGEELFAQADYIPGFFMSRYSGKHEFDESFFRVGSNAADAVF